MREMSSMDIMLLLNELKLLTGGRFQKTYQNDKRLRFEIHLSEKGTFELYFEPGRLFITEYKRKFEQPGSFAMLMRKHLKNQSILNIRQKDFDRIIEIETENYILILEVFSKGNVILCYKDYKILMPLQFQKWKHRTIRPGIKYEYPPAVKNPFTISLEEFKNTLNEKETVKFLATDMSFSGLYAEEICIRSGIDKNKVANQLTDQEIENIYEVMKHLKNEFGPQIIVDSGKIIDAIPFDMKCYSGIEMIRSTTFTHALDEFYSKSEEIRNEVDQTKKIQKSVEKLQRIVDQQRQSIETLKKDEENSRKVAEIVFSNLQPINDVISQINEMKNKGMKWNDIKERLKNQIKDINEKTGKVILDI